MVQLEAGVEYTSLQTKGLEADGLKRRNGMERNLSACVADTQRTSTAGGSCAQKGYRSLGP